MTRKYVLYWVSFILSMFYTGFPSYSACFILGFLHTQHVLYWVSFILSMFYTGFPSYSACFILGFLHTQHVLYWVSFILSMFYTGFPSYSACFILGFLHTQHVLSFWGRLFINFRLVANKIQKRKTASPTIGRIFSYLSLPSLRTNGTGYC